MCSAMRSDLVNDPPTAPSAGGRIVVWDAGSPGDTRITPRPTDRPTRRALIRFDREGVAEPANFEPRVFIAHLRNLLDSI